MKKNILTISLLLSSFILLAQGKYYTKSGKIYFNASAKMEKVEASNRSVIAVMDTKTGTIQFAVMLKGFEFEKALMSMLPCRPAGENWRA